MKPRFVVAILALASLVGFVATTAPTPVPAPKAAPPSPPPTLPAGVAALSGVWEGVGPESIPTRLVVEELHENWAVVLYTWGEQPDGKFQRGWVRVRAKVLPEGTLFWRHPGDFTFRLSEDRTTLVGIRAQAGNTATSLMRRAPSGVGLNAITQGESH